MSKYILIPDSFKGSLSSAEICAIITREIRRLEPEATVCSLPVADGGEGTVDAFLAAVGGQRVSAPCQGPYGQSMTACYSLLPDGVTAVVEMAAAAGLPLVGEDRCVADATTYGVGQLIAHALEHGAERIVLGLGGSATNDGGCGAAAALGVEFLDETGHAFVPVGRTLGRIAHIRMESVLPQLRQAEVVAMCDIDNPLCGESGAAAVFAPQKGADAQTVRLLDSGLRHLAQVAERDLGVSLLNLSGGGAAGAGRASTSARSSACSAARSAKCTLRGAPSFQRTSCAVPCSSSQADSQASRSSVRSSCSGVPPQSKDRTAVRWAASSGSRTMGRSVLAESFQWKARMGSPGR